LNPVSAGATLSVDSRYLTGLSNGTGVSSAGRIKSTILTQGTPANQPTYNTSGLNGSPVMNFSGSNLLYNSNGWSDSGTWTMISLENHTSFSVNNDRMMGVNDTGLRVFYATNAASSGEIGFAWSTVSGRIYSAANSALVNNWRITSVTYSGGIGSMQLGSINIFINGSNSRNTPQDIAGTAISSITNDSIYIGNRPALDRGFIGSIASAIAIPQSVQTALRKRLEHAVAFSFRLPCS
jgi:hypothetical protein